MTGGQGVAGSNPAAPTEIGKKGTLVTHCADWGVFVCFAIGKSARISLRGAPLTADPDGVRTLGGRLLGHTDDVGDRKHDLTLSEQRAAAVTSRERSPRSLPHCSWSLASAHSSSCYTRRKTRERR